MKRELLIPADKIIKGIFAHSQILNHLFQHKQVTLMPIMEGADFYCQNLKKHLEFDYVMDSITIKSYSGTESKELRVSQHPSTDLYGKTVLILDDIYDTGKTMQFAKKLCNQRGALSVFSSVLLYKLNVPNQIGNTLDFSCMNIPNVYVIGSGFDLDGKFRDLKGIWKIPSTAY